MSFKSKGINAERDLIHRFWSKGVPAVRVAGSGSTRFPSPDIVAGTHKRKMAIEAKITKEHKKYFTKDAVEDLNEYCRLFGAEAWVAVKFKGSEWLFLRTGELNDAGGSYYTDLENAKRKGLLFEELVSLL